MSVAPSRRRSMGRAYPVEKTPSSRRRSAQEEETGMKRLALAATIAVLLLPGVARAGAATDAALGLGAFAVFNQILSGTGIFGGAPAVAAPAPVVVAPPPPVVYQPASGVYRPAPGSVAP